MYTPTNLLADYVAINKRRLQFRDRWKSESGKLLSEQFIQAIVAGKVDVLQAALLLAPATFLSGSFDLRGLRYVDLTISRPETELLRNANLNYSRLRDVEFNRASLISVTADFSDVVRTHFVETSFVRANFFGANFEDCVFEDCNFLDRNSFSNCSFKNVSFINCFFETDVFNDCLFDEQTEVVAVRLQSHHFSYYKHAAKKYDNRFSTSLYSGIREAYEAGHVSTLARKYLFKEKQAFTRYNTDSRERLIRLFLEYTNGYGIRPLRVLLTASSVFALCCAVFVAQFGEPGFFLSAGGFFTFGANTDLLTNAAISYHILYVLEAFLGITSTSVFIVTLTNYWSSLR